MNEFVATIDGLKKKIHITSKNTAVIDGEKYTYEVKHLLNGLYLLSINNKVYQAFAGYNNSGYNIFTNGCSINVVVRSAEEEAIEQIQFLSTGKIHKNNVFAPMPGMIIKINFKEGDIVEAGEAIVILEAMKMENVIYAPVKGIINKIYIAEGNSVEKGTAMFNIELL